MTVKELIDLLSNCDGNLRVVVQYRDTDLQTLWDVIAVTDAVQLYRDGNKVEKTVIIQ